ncbi:endonuclease domain-containing protein [Flaviaesturariibacter amylovorans]
MESLPTGPYNRYGYQWADPYHYRQLKQLVQEQRRYPTHAESMLWDALRGKALQGNKFRRQHIVGKYLADFVCLKKRLIIEVDGLIHQLPENQESDAVRTANLNILGFQVLCFTNDQILYALDSVLNEISVLLSELPEVPAEKGKEMLSQKR